MRTSIYALARQVRLPGHIKYLYEGIRPATPPATVGFHVLTPAQVAGLGVDLFSLEHKNGGFQRDANPRQVANIAEAQTAGYPIPPILYNINDDGTTSVIDGDHRGLASIASGVDLWAVAIQVDQETCNRLFAAQGKGINVNKSHLVLIGDNALNRYINDACRSAKGEHPWAGLVAKRGGKHDMSASQLYQLLGSFIAGWNASGNGWEKATSPQVLEERWDPTKADLLAELVSSFGTKTQNPFAHKFTSLKAIVNVARRTVFTRPEGRARTQEIMRWKSHMPKFKFDDAIWALSSTDLIEQLLVAHWNKGQISTDRRA